MMITMMKNIWLDKDLFFYLFKTIYINRNKYLYTANCIPGSVSGKEPACQCKRYKRHRFDS